MLSFDFTRLLPAGNVAQHDFCIKTRKTGNPIEQVDLLPNSAGKVIRVYMVIGNTIFVKAISNLHGC